MRLPSWARGTLLLVLTLTAGFFIGIGYERHHASTHVEFGPHHMLDRLTVQLALDSTQAKAIAAILARRQGEVDSTWHAMQPHVRAAMDSTLREILAVLRPEQASKYRSMVQRLHPGTLP